MNVLALNAGSSSLKFELVDTRASEQAGARGSAVATLVRGSVRGFGSKSELVVASGGGEEHTPVVAADAGEAVRVALERLARRFGVAPDPPLALVEAVGHRIVHGGPRFSSAVRLDAGVLAEIEALEELAPLHNTAALAGIRAAQEVLGLELAAAAVFDTAFFHDLPERAAAYALPRELARRHGIRRFGFHGISHAYLAARYAELEQEGGADAAIVTLHLGSGCSAAAIRRGRPVDTSMGFTPLEGLVMATRSGDIDPALVGFLVRRERVPVEEVEAWLNRNSGLLGLTGTSDVREALERERRGDRDAALGVELYCYRARKYLGAYLAALGDAGALVFAGGVGENVPEVRARICHGMEWCGLRLDEARNRAAVAVEARISPEAAVPRVYVIPTREERWIACETARCLASQPRAD